MKTHINKNKRAGIAETRSNNIGQHETETTKAPKSGNDRCTTPNQNRAIELHRRFSGVLHNNKLANKEFNDSLEECKIFSSVTCDCNCFNVIENIHLS